MERLWDLRCPGLHLTTLRTQLLCLRDLLGDADLAGRVALAHNELSGVLHHRVGATPPTHAELLGWIETAWQLADRVSELDDEAVATRRTREAARARTGT